MATSSLKLTPTPTLSLNLILLTLTNTERRQFANRRRLQLTGQIVIHDASCAYRDAHLYTWQVR